MKTMSYAESRARYAEMLDGVINDREEVVITRAGHEPVVVMALKETAYLTRSPANARRLLDAMERLGSQPRPGRDRLTCHSSSAKTPAARAAAGTPSPWAHTAQNLSSTRREILERPTQHTHSQCWTVALTPRTRAACRRNFFTRPTPGGRRQPAATVATTIATTITAIMIPSPAGRICPLASARRASGNSRQKNTAIDAANAQPAATFVSWVPVRTTTASRARKMTLTPATQ